MVRLGTTFKAPPKRATNQWLKVELLYIFGERFHPGYYALDEACKTLSQTVSYLVDRGNERTEVQDCLQRIRKRRRLD